MYSLEGGSYREQVYHSKGHKFSPKNHNAYALRWNAGESKDGFEQRLTALKKEQAKLKITAD